MMTHTKNQSIAGTYMFMPLEQLNNQSLDFRTDIFAAGVTLYNLACRDYPHQKLCQSLGVALSEIVSWAKTPPPSLEQRKSSIDLEFARIVAKAIAVDPSGRYQTATEMLHDLRLLLPESGDIIFPSEWTPQSDDKAERGYDWWRKAVLATVPTGTSEWEGVEGMLHDSLPTAALVKLQRYQSRQLHFTFSHKTDVVGLKNGGDAREMMLWHGTSDTDPRLVLKSESSLDYRFSEKGFYGTGIYGAEKASYSDCYTYKVPEPVDGRQGCRRFLLVQFTLGKSKPFGTEIDRDLRLPPPLLPGSSDRYDSVSGGPHSGSMMHIVYENDMVYPKYLVTYCK
jgi:serine/threonine protein kinase